ncbi:hypothetical protein ACDF64_16445 [Agromyces sp. MMS24-JH15]|uniref:hypothetical protein n=1 Tax=Agromyces sp. MMS24-JH15 TaxID=3243765 RepID=UPI0037499B71
MRQVDVVDARHRHRGVRGDQAHRLEFGAHHPHLAREHPDVRGRRDLQHDLPTVAQSDAVRDVEPALGDLVREPVVGRHRVGAVGPFDEPTQGRRGLPVLGDALHRALSRPRAR